MSLDNDDVYKTPGADAILNRAAKEPLVDDPSAPQFLYRAAWRTEGGKLSPYGGHNLQQDGPLGANAAIGQTGELTATHRAALLADANAVFSRTPPQPNTPEYTTPSYKQTWANKLG